MVTVGGEFLCVCCRHDRRSGMSALELGVRGLARSGDGGIGGQHRRRGERRNSCAAQLTHPRPLADQLTQKSAPLDRLPQLWHERLAPVLPLLAPLLRRCLGAVASRPAEDATAQLLAVRRPLCSCWRPFWLSFTYVTSVFVKKCEDHTTAAARRTRSSSCCAPSAPSRCPTCRPRPRRPSTTRWWAACARWRSSRM